MKIKILLSALLLTSFCQASLPETVENDVDKLLQRKTLFTGTTNIKDLLEIWAQQLREEDPELTEDDALKRAQQRFDNLKNISPRNKERKLPRRFSSPAKIEKIK